MATKKATDKKATDKKAERERLTYLDNNWCTVRLATFGIIHQLEAMAASISEVAIEFSDGRPYVLNGLSGEVKKMAARVKEVMDGEVKASDEGWARLEGYK